MISYYVLDIVLLPCNSTDPPCCVYTGHCVTQYMVNMASRTVPVLLLESLRSLGNFSLYCRNP